MRNDYEDTELSDDDRRKQERLSLLGDDVKKKIHHAVEYKRTTGVERRMQEDQDYYEGKDALSSMSEEGYTKSRSADGPLVANSSSQTDQKNTCTEFFNMTAMFTDAASARMGDILLPAGDHNFSIEATAVPEEVGIPQDILEQAPELQDFAAQQAEQLPPEQGGILGPAQEQLPPEQGGMMGQPQMAGAPIDTAAPPAGEPDVVAKSDKGEERIKDWVTEGRLHMHQRKVIENAARLGTGILKGPTPSTRMSRAFVDSVIMEKEEIVPESESVPPMDFFPDPNCGDDIQKGDYVVERAYMTARQLHELKNDPAGYNAEAIDKVIDEGPDRGNYESDTEQKTKYTKDTDRFTVWHFHGSIDVADLDLVDNLAEEDDEEDETYEVVDEEKGDNDDVAGKVLEGEVITKSENEEGKQPRRTHEYQRVVLVLVNGSIIKGHTAPLDKSGFPYDVMCWQKVAGSPFGIGVPRQGRVGQKMILAAGRALMDNMALSSGVMLGVLRSAVEPADKRWTLSRNKVFWIKESSGLKSVRDAITSFEVPSRQAELVAIMELGRKMMEDATGVVFLLQGQQGSAPDTVGGMNLLHQNASALLRRVARNFDEQVTEPHIIRYYDWLLMQGEDDEKSDLQVKAIGSSALVEREIQAQQAEAILSMAQNPVFGYSPKKAADELLRSWRFEPSKFEMDEEEKAAAAEAAQSQQDPRMVVEQMKLEAAQALAQMKMEFEQQMVQAKFQHEQQIIEMKAQADFEKAEAAREIELQKMKVDMDRDATFAQGVTERNQMTYEKNIAELELKRELAMLEHANKMNLQLEDVKAKLAGDAMKINLQRELALAGDAAKPAEQIITPPSEPAGRAPEGQAFQK
jgi:hypothetical protein